MDKDSVRFTMTETTQDHCQKLVYRPPSSYEKPKESIPITPSNSEKNGFILDESWVVNLRSVGDE